MTDDQRGAIDELKEIEAASQGGFEILRTKDPAETNSWVWVDLSISCEGFERRENGLKLRDREQISLAIPANYPYVPPSTFAHGHRLALREHVTWIAPGTNGVNICIYYSPERQWHPELGMPGFVNELLGWLERAARGELDVRGAPIHPPIINEGEADEFFVAHADAPEVNGSWLGYAEVEQKTDRRFDITAWHEHVVRTYNRLLAPTVLIDTPFVSELPNYVSILIELFERFGIAKDALSDLLIAYAFQHPINQPLYIMFGTSMRGTVGQQDRRQHLVVWRIGPTVSNRLCNLARRHKKVTARRAEKMVLSGVQLIDKWAQSHDRLAWCRVMDQRPEVSIRRDHTSGTQWFHGKSATIWGCGALGSAAAEYLARAGARKLTVVDNGIVTPGLLVRQNFTDADIGRRKASSLAERLGHINPRLEVCSRAENLLSTTCNMADHLADANVLIDATASNLVALKLEKERREGLLPSIPVVSMGIDAMAGRSLVTMSPAVYSGGPVDLMRKGHITLAALGGMPGAVNAFWPEEEEDWFEPEPGCSSPTFVGSAADIAALTGDMIGVIGAALSEESDEGSVHFGVRGKFARDHGEAPQCLSFPADDILNCPETGYEIRVSPEARATMDEVLRVSTSKVGPTPETGGVLFGERNDFLKVVWVTQASGPPNDSTATASEFVCGIEGVAEAHAAKVKNSGAALGFIGMWHSHPGGSASPSATDMETMQQLVSGPDAVGRRVLLVIVGYRGGAAEVAGRIYQAAAA